MEKSSPSHQYIYVFIFLETGLPTYRANQDSDLYILRLLLEYTLI